MGIICKGRNNRGHVNGCVATCQQGTYGALASWIAHIDVSEALKMARHLQKQFVTLTCSFWVF